MRLRDKQAWVLRCVAGLALAASASGAWAQSTASYSAGNMWGTAPAGVAVPGAFDSSVTHAQDAALAGAVNAAEAGVLVNGIGSSLTISSVGSQTIVQNSVYGSSNSVNLNSSQSSSNTGAVSNSGTIQKQ
jgi:hypothetical protein